jgi:hypothetical protein
MSYELSVLKKNKLARFHQWFVCAILPWRIKPSGFTAPFAWFLHFIGPAAA